MKISEDKFKSLEDEYIDIRMNSGDLETETSRVFESAQRFTAAKFVSETLWMTQSVPTPEVVSEALRNEYRCLTELSDNLLEHAIKLSRIRMKKRMQE